jgi:pimeloyl-ACP methyl ester carboxylesterase
MRELPVLIPDRQGNRLFGILHEPAEPRVPRVGISLLNPGLKSRVAPNRLNVTLGRRLADRGYHVLRIDPPGIGDSSGDLPEDPFQVLWQRVQRGEFVDSVREVHRAFAREAELDEIVGMGNCGGAITALLEARSNPLVRRLVLIDIPVTLKDPNPRAAARILGKEHAGRVLASYARRMKDWRAWVRLLTFKSDSGTIGRALKARFFNRRSARQAPGGREEGPGAESGPAPGEGLSELFAEGFMKFHEDGGRALFLHAGAFHETYLFNDLVGETYMAPGTDLAERHRRVTIDGANHIYGTPEWSTELFEAIESWLEESAR